MMRECRPTMAQMDNSLSARSVLMPFILAALLWAGPSRAGEADVIKAEAQPMRDGSYVIIATILHADESFDHFANKFEILDPDGNLLGTRMLVHPHIEEQPFTRALPRVKIPQGIKQVIVRAHDKQHGYGGKEIVVKLPDR